MKVHTYFYFENKYYKFPIELLSPRFNNFFKINSIVIKTNGWSDSYPMIVMEKLDLCYNDLNYSVFEPIEVSEEDFNTIVFSGVEYGK